MKVHRIVHDAAALPPLVRLNSLDLEALEALAEDSVAAEVDTGIGLFGIRIWTGSTGRRQVAGQYADVAAQQADGGACPHTPRLSGRAGDVGVLVGAGACGDILCAQIERDAIVGIGDGLAVLERDYRVTAGCIVGFDLKLLGMPRR